MRTLSKRTQYSLRALYALARNYQKGPRLIADLAAEEAIPRKFLEQILLLLKSRGLVESKKGRGGGYALSRPPGEITIGIVIRLIEGPLAPIPCASETAFRKCPECTDVATCGTRMVMREVRNAIADVLDKTTLSAVCHRVALAEERKAEAQNPDEPQELMYYI